MTAWTWPGTRITRIIDGDTIDATVTRDLGFGGNVTFPVRLRLHRINAPALSNTRGRAARDRLTELLPTARIYTVTTVKPYKYGGPADGAGEYMAEVDLPDGRRVSDVLAGEGHATYWDGNGPRPADD